MAITFWNVLRPEVDEIFTFLVSFSADDDDAIEFERGASATGVSV